MIGEVQLFARRDIRPFSYLVGMLVLALFLATPPALAQLDTGSISGVVTDPTGSAIKNAAISARETSTGTTYSTTSSNAGYYVLPSIRTGAYELKVEAAGFKTAVYTGVVVTVGSQMGRDVALAVGTVSETTTVTANSLTLETESSKSMTRSPGTKSTIFPWP